MESMGDTHSASSLMSERFQSLPRAVIVAVGLLLVTGIAILDFSTSSRVVVSICYLLPVMLVAWATASTGCGLIVALTTFLAEPVGEMLTHYRYHSMPVAIWNGAMRLAVFCIVLLLMQRVRMLMGRLQEAALADELTGLANLRALREMAAKEIERSRRFNHPVTLAYVDIDDLKRVNDRAGHAAGNRVLISLATIARATTRSVDTVARVGGDEFVILMPETGPDTALLVADRLREAFSQAVKPQGVPSTCSIGLASFERPSASVDEMLATADELMYEAKAAGKDTLRLVHVESHLGETRSDNLVAMSSARQGTAQPASRRT